MDSTTSINNLRTMLQRPVFMQDSTHEYERYIIQIEANRASEPNIAFEAVKSLSEAIFRHVLAHGRIKSEFSAVLTARQPSTYDLFKSCCRALSDLNLLDIELLGLGQKFFNDIAQIRNSVGIISHGKDLRDISNLRLPTVELAIANATNHLVVILDAYEQLLGEPELSYEDSAEFNEYLDTQYNINGISYSQALYNQDLVAYNELLDEYNEVANELS